MGQFGQVKGQPAPNAGHRYRVEPLTAAEISLILGQCSMRAPTGVRNRALLTMLYRSGLRINEALTLKASDVNLAKHSIRVLDPKAGVAQTRGFHPSADDTLAALARHPQAARAP